MGTRRLNNIFCVMKTYSRHDLLNFWAYLCCFIQIYVPWVENHIMVRKITSVAAQVQWGLAFPAWLLLK